MIESPDPPADNRRLVCEFIRGRRIWRFDHGPGRVLRKDAGGSESHAEDAISKGRDADFGGSSGQLNAIFQFFDALDFTNVLPALCNHCPPLRAQASRPIRCVERPLSLQPSRE